MMFLKKTVAVIGKVENFISPFTMSCLANNKPLEKMFEIIVSFYLFSPIKRLKSGDGEKEVELSNRSLEHTQGLSGKFNVSGHLKYCYLKRRSRYVWDNSSVVTASRSNV